MVLFTIYIQSHLFLPIKVHHLDQGINALLTITIKLQS